MGYGLIALNNARQRAQSAADLIRAAGLKPAPTSIFRPQGVFADYIQQGQSLARTRDQFNANWGWVNAGLTAIIQRAASQPFHVGEVYEGQDKISRRVQRKDIAGFSIPIPKDFLPGFLKSHYQDMEVLPDHSMARAIEDPNPILVRWSLMAVTIACLKLTGMGYWWILPSKDPDREIEIWPLPPTWVKPNHGKKLFESWIIQHESSQEKITVPGEQIVCFHLPDPANPILGTLSPIQAQALPITLDQNISRCQVQFFQNGIHPGWAVVIGRTDPGPNVIPGTPNQRAVLTDSQRDAMIEKIRMRLQGMYRYNEPVILDGLIEDIKRLTLTTRELDFIGSAKFTKERITQGLGVNPIVMGEIEGANRASAAIADQHFCANTINPILELMSQVVTAWLGYIFRKEGRKLVGYFEPAQPQDSEMAQRRWEFGARNGHCTLNEYRQEVLHKPPFPGGDVIAVPKGTVFLDPAQLGTPSPTAEPKEEEKNFTFSQGLSQKDLDEIWQKSLNDAEKLMARHMRAFFEDEAKRVAGNLRGLDVPTSLLAEVHAENMILDNEFFLLRFKMAFKKGLLEAGKLGAKLESSLTALRTPHGNRIVTKEDLPQEVLDALDEYAQEMSDKGFWNDMPDELKAAIFALIIAGVIAGKTTEQIALELQILIGDEWGPDKAEAIATTEVHGMTQAAVYTLQQLLFQQGRIVARQWLTQLDEIVRQTHQVTHGQIRGVHELFDVGGEPARYPGDPQLSVGNRVRCRCFLTSIAV